MSERAQALEHLQRLARDIGDVRDVAGRRSDPPREHQQMLARLGQWRGGILTVIDILQAPPVGVSPQPDEYRERMRLHDLVLEVLAAWQESENEDDIVKRSRTRTAFRDRLKSPASLSPVEPTPLTEQFMVDALAAAVADRDHSDAQLAAIEAVVRQELCPIENSESQGDDEPEPRYICMSEDGDRIIEADDIPGVIRQVVARWDAAGKRCEAAKAALETIKSAPVEPTPEPPTEKIPDAELDAVLAGVYADRRPAPTGAPAPCVWRPVREGSAWLKPTCRDFALSFLPAKAHEFAGCPYCLKPLTVER